MPWATLQQLIRIAMMTGGVYFFGQETADGELYQNAISGVIAFSGFAWWAVREWRGGAGAAMRSVIGPMLLVVALGACGNLSSRAAALETLVETCRSYAGALRVLTPHKAVRLLDPEEIRIIDLANQATDPFCLPGSPPPADVGDAIRQVNQAVVQVLLIAGTEN